MANPLPSIFTGPAIALPRHLDQIAERWARLPWRLRAALLICAGLTMLWWHANRVNTAKAALGALHHVWVATETLTPGSDPAGKFKRTAVPAEITPADAIGDEPTASPVLTIVAGTVATSVHFEGVDKAPAVPAGHRAVAIATHDADLFAPGSRVDLWDLSGDEPTILVEQLIVVSVKAQRVIIGVPDATASVVVQRAASNALRVAPAGLAETGTKTNAAPQPAGGKTEPLPEKTRPSQAVAPETPTAKAPAPQPRSSSIRRSASPVHRTVAQNLAIPKVRSGHQAHARPRHTQRVLKPP